MSESILLECRCPSCGHGVMWLVVCKEYEPSVGQPGFHCRGCGAEWDLADIEEIVSDYKEALILARATLGEPS